MLAIVSTPDPEQPTAIAEVDEPLPAPDRAVVAIRAFALNRGELKLLQMRPNAWRPGQDVAGVVLQAAADGSGPPAGSRVVAFLEGAGWAQRAAIGTARMAVLPASVSDAQAATLPIAGLTAYRSIRLGDSLLGEKVLITGASGGVGQFAVRLAVLAGARVSALVTRAEHAAQLLALGAQEVVADSDQLQGPFAYVLESVGGATFRAAVRTVRARGTIVVIGNSSGEPASFSIYDFFGHEDARILTFFSYFSPATVSQDLSTLVQLVGDGRLSPQIGLEGNWHELNALLKALRERRVRGKAVAHIG